jgi:hypothetical protein
MWQGKLRFSTILYFATRYTPVAYLIINQFGMANVTSQVFIFFVPVILEAHLLLVCLGGLELVFCA